MRRFPIAALIGAMVVGVAASAEAWVEPPFLAARVAAKQLPPIEQRLPENPSVEALDRPWQTPGRHGGTLRMLMGRAQDTRMMVVYGYARLVGFDAEWNFVPDIVADFTVEDDRVFTFRLRKGHRWSDGHPFTADDFRFYWEDVLNNAELHPSGVPQVFRVDGKPPRFEVVDETTVRYTWDGPNPHFLPLLAGARPEPLYQPAHHMKRFHAGYVDAETLRRKVAEERHRNWESLFFHHGHQYQNDDPTLPTLQPWVLVTTPPSTRFVFERNPYYHRVDPEGRQLPYIDTVTFTVVSPKLIPAKTAAGDADLQARALGFDNFAVLKQGERRHDFSVRLWRTARGSELALLPNLTTIDAAWRPLLRDVNFRRALSLAINRAEINQVIFFGLAQPANDTVLPASPLHKPAFTTLWAEFDPDQANRLLDQIGLGKRNAEGIRLFPDGRTAELIVETAGENPTEVDVLQLVRDAWQKIGIRLHIKPQQREVLRNRVFAGAATMSVWSGIENALPNADTSPRELAPTSQYQLYWPKWGLHFETRGQAGEPIDLEPAAELARLNDAWEAARDAAERAAIWQRMLTIRAEQVFTIGTVQGVPQPVVVSNRLRNVPEEGIYNWDPGAHFGLYRPDVFWWADGADRTGK
ncbi:MAG: ABC transporter substrate-binding protein [Rhodospirillales bacterium]